MPVKWAVEIIKFSNPDFSRLIVIVFIYHGEDEPEALAMNALCVVQNELEKCGKLHFIFHY